jgi:hypothetical protein
MNRVGRNKESKNEKNNDFINDHVFKFFRIFKGDHFEKTRG